MSAVLFSFISCSLFHTDTNDRYRGFKDSETYFRRKSWLPLPSLTYISLYRASTGHVAYFKVLRFPWLFHTFLTAETYVKKNISLKVMNVRVNKCKDFESFLKDSCSPRLHLFVQIYSKNSNIVKYCCNLK